MIQNFLTILIKFGTAFLFVLLEIFCFYLIVNYNKNQKDIWANSSNIIVGSFYDRYSRFTNFMNLREENEKLALENAKLRSSLLSKDFKAQFQDSVVASNFEFIPALIINNSISKLNNKITINKGTNHGVQKGMGIISSNGIVGVIVNTSNKYSTVISVLNIRTKVSGLIKRTNTLGDITWKGKDPSFLQMNSVPQYVPLLLGDTIVTSGYSTVFPKGQMVGTIDKVVENSRTGYYDIDIDVSADLASLNQVYVVKNIIFDDVKEFENTSENE